MSYADFHLGKPAPQGHQEFSFVMATTVDDLSYTPSEEERSRDAAQFVATGRKSWKTLKGKGEAVWPPLLEAALLEALEKYSPDAGNSKGDKTMGRFPMRNRFISDYIFETTGKRRTPKQVGSRLQQLRDTCKKDHILALISHRHTPEHSSIDSHSNYTASPSPRPESRPPPPTSMSNVFVQIVLQGELWPSAMPTINLVSNDSSHAQTIQLSALSQQSSYYSENSLNILPFFSSEIEIRSQYALEQESTFLVYTSNRRTPIHMEKAPLVCLSSPVQRSGWFYRSSLVSQFWATLCSTEDLSQFVIVQQLKPANAGAISSLSSVDRCSASQQVISVVYKFDARVSASRRSSLVTPLAYQSATPNTEVHSVSSEMTHTGLPGVTSPYTWQIDAGSDLSNNDCYQSLAGRSRHVDHNMHYVGQAMTGMATYNAYQQQQSCAVPELHVKESQDAWGRANIHAPVPLQHSHQLDNFYYP